MDRKLIQCLPAVGRQLAHVNLDKYRGVPIVEGKWVHPYNGYEVDMTKELLGHIVDEWNEHRTELEIPIVNGHPGSRNALGVLGYLDSGSVARIVDVEFRGETRKGIEFIYDIRDPDAKAAAKAGTLKGQSVGYDSDYRISRPDGKVEELGGFFEHIALTPIPVIAGLPDFTPVLALSKDGKQELEVVELDDLKSLSSRLTTWQDPPKEVIRGDRRASHQECGYQAGTADANCGKCLAFLTVWDETSQSFVPHCEWVADPIKASGVCKYQRPKGCFEMRPDGLPLLRLDFAKDAKHPYGDVSYADPGYQPDGKSRYPVDTREHIEAAWKYIHTATNKSKYGGGDWKKVVGAIVRAWKSKIDSAGPPSAQMSLDADDGPELDLSDETAIRSAIAWLDSEKAKKTYSQKLLDDLRSRTVEAGTQIIGPQWTNGTEEKHMAFDLKQLAKRVEVAEPADTTTVDEFASLVAAKAVTNFCKDLGIAIADPARAGDAVKAHFAKAGAADAVLINTNERLSGELAASKTSHIAELDKIRGDHKAELKTELSKRDEKIAEFERAAELARAEASIGKLKTRVEALLSTGRIAKAQEDVLTTVGQDTNGKPRRFSLEFDRGNTKIDDGWRADLSRVDSMVAAYEALPEHSIVPKEKTPRVLSRTEGGSTADDAQRKADADKKAELSKRSDERAARVNPRKKSKVVD